MKTLTVIIREKDSPFPPIYTYPLIYTIQVKDVTDDGEILARVTDQRCDDLSVDPDEEDYEDTFQAVQGGLELLFAFEGDLSTVKDWR